MRRIKLGRQERRNLGWGLLFISPYIVGFLAFTVYPIIASFIFSFTNFNIINFQPDWVGLRNYVQLFTLDRYFPISLGNTFRYTAMLLVIATVVDIFAAFLLNLNVRGLSVYRSALFLPVLTPAVASALTWVWILNPKRGLVNGLLGMVGIVGPPWLASKRTALFSLVLLSVWGTGRSILIYLAGLKEIPTQLYEAAEIDGASAWRRMWHVTIPLLTPQILFNMITMLIGSLQSFVGPFIMTGGGPANSTLLYGLYLYRRAFLNMRMGLASAMAWILFVVILVLTLLMLRVSQRVVVYDR
jgi:multiple sugar transport system permease protein